MSNVNRMSTTEYQYQLYNNYMDKLDENMIKYGQQNSMSIQYWHIKVNDSKNWNESNMHSNYKDFVYDIFHFVPTMEMSPLTYQIGHSINHRGTSNIATGTFTMYLVQQPLPGDLFKFYSNDDVTDSGEVFRITNVRYMRTAKNKLKVYQLDFETAPMKMSTLEQVRINKTWYWNTEQFNFFDSNKYDAYANLLENRDALVEEINQYYDAANGWYAPTDAKPLVFLNTILKRVKRQFEGIKLKVIHGVGTVKIPIDWILQDNYWDSFICLSQVDVQAGEIDGSIFNLSKILEGLCDTCPQEIIDELLPYQDLFQKVKALVEMSAPFIDEAILSDTTCDSSCCDQMDANFINECITSYMIQDGENFDSLATDANGSIEPNSNIYDSLAEDSAVTVPLWISFQNGFGPKKKVPFPNVYKGGDN